MSAESIDCSHDEWVYAEDRCALCGVTAFDLIIASQASFMAHMREAAEVWTVKQEAEWAEQRRMWEERAPLRAAIARESASFKAWEAKQAAERAVASPRPAFPARALRMWSWSIGDLVE